MAQLSHFCFGQKSGDFGQKSGDFGQKSGDFGQKSGDFGQNIGKSAIFALFSVFSIDKSQKYSVVKRKNTA